jgi:hypothetical protein
MSWSIGYDENWKRDIGYGVPATCDHPGCAEEINRGLSYVCGGDPYGGEHGCGLFFCTKHRMYAGDRRENASLCTRCYWGKGATYTPSPDVSEWISHKLTHESWQRWRDENPEEVAAAQAQVNQQNHALEEKVRG